MESVAMCLFSKDVAYGFVCVCVRVRVCVCACACVSGLFTWKDLELTIEKKTG